MTNQKIHMFDVVLSACASVFGLAAWSALVVGRESAVLLSPTIHCELSVNVMLYTGACDTGFCVVHDVIQAITLVHIKMWAIFCISSPHGLLYRHRIVCMIRHDNVRKTPVCRTAHTGNETNHRPLCRTVCTVSCGLVRD